MADARRAAVMALVRQEQQGYSNLVLKQLLDSSGLCAEERALTTAIFYGVIERLYTIDWILQSFTAKPLSKADPQVRAVLRSGLYQAKWLDSVPVYTAVDEAVRLCKRLGHMRAAAMVNAVLRKAAAFSWQQAAFPNEEQRLCTTYSVSTDVYRVLRRALGEACEQVLNASFERPVFAVRTNLAKTTPTALCALFEKAGMHACEGDVPGSVLVEWRGSLTEFEPFRKGLFHVQGQASQLACAVLDAQPQDTVLDLCAAPGGKAATIAQSLTRGQLLAFDLHPARAALIEQTAQRLGLNNITVRAADMTAADTLPVADRVLCDVPCTGLGTLAKKPDVRYKKLGDLRPLLHIQQQILDTAAYAVRPGGVLVYATCTLNPQENERAVQRFLERNPAFQLVQPQVKMPLWAQCRDGLLKCLPCARADGFFIAKMRRNAQIMPRE